MGKTCLSLLFALQRAYSRVIILAILSGCSGRSSDLLTSLSVCMCVSDGITAWQAARAVDPEQSSLCVYLLCGRAAARSLSCLLLCLTERLREEASVLMQRLSYPTDTVITNRIARSRICTPIIQRQSKKTIRTETEFDRHRTETE